LVWGKKSEKGQKGFEEEPGQKKWKEKRTEPMREVKTKILRL